MLLTFEWLNINQTYSSVSELFMQIWRQILKIHLPSSFSIVILVLGKGERLTPAPAIR